MRTVGYFEYLLFYAIIVVMGDISYATSWFFTAFSALSV